MGGSAKLALWVIALSLVVLAAEAVYDRVEETRVATDVRTVWCDGNRSIIALAAETLGLLPEDLESRLIDLVGDDPSDQTVDLTDRTTLGLFRLFRDLVAQSPPIAFGDLGFPTEGNFEAIDVLGARALSGAARITSDWIEELDDGWNDPSVDRACAAAFGAYR